MSARVPTPIFSDLWHESPGIAGSNLVTLDEYLQLRDEFDALVEACDWWRVADVAARLATVQIVADTIRRTGAPRPVYGSQPDPTGRRTLKDKTIPAATRAKVYAEHGTACAYCGDPDGTTIDHVIPRSKGGTDDLENLRPACRTCNTSKGTKDVDEWLANR